jgi:hypothetical protein
MNHTLYLLKISGEKIIRFYFGQKCFSARAQLEDLLEGLKV